jgi:DNA-directed RNA polymerase
MMASEACVPESEVDSLLVAQEALEEESRVLGKQKFEKLLKSAEEAGEASREGAYRQLVVRGLEMVEAALRHMLENRRRGGQHMALRWVELVGPETAAYLALRVALDGVAQGTTVVDAAMRLSGFILDELRYRRLKEQAPQLYDYKLRNFKSTHYSHMKGSLDMTLTYAGIDVAGLTMSKRDRLLVGCKLLDVVSQVTHIVSLSRGISTRIVSTRRGMRRNKTLRLEPGPGLHEWLDERNERLADLTFTLYPMVVPPVDWAPMQRGGYRFRLRSMFPLVRAHDPKVSAEHERRDQPVVFNALNTLQQTAWRINPSVLALVTELQQIGGGVAGLASYEREPLPLKTAALLADREKWLEWQKQNRGALTASVKRQAPRTGRQLKRAVKAAVTPPAIPEDVNAARLRWREWRRKVGEIKDRDLPRRSRVVAQGATIRAAKRMAEYPAIYFPYTLDFRGRVYALASFLNPQGDDLNKALLTFASGKPIGDDGARWLAIHGANCMDTTPEGDKISRMTLDEREKWILRHTAEIRRSAANPLEYRWWMQAEKPLQFYAFCVEWAAALDERARTGEWSYTCSLPVAMDGSCNGLQHFSAMFRDEVGGRAVNLSNNDRPRDVYTEVAANVGDMLVKDSADPLALKWLQSGLVNRKLCKRPTMTFGYGAKKWGFRDQLLAELKGRDDFAAIKRHFGVEAEDGSRMKDGLPAACTYLSTKIDDALGVTVVAAAQAMKWLQSFALGISSENKVVEWQVPVTGFRVRQEYYRSIQRQVKTTLAGSVIYPVAYSATQDVRAQKQANAVAPNVVHSFDAAVLMLTVGEAAHEGISHFRMIHDSFATVPGDASKLAEITRRVFVNFYLENDVVGELQSQLTSQLPVGAEIPEVPPYGNLDLREVEDSKYFFA